MNTLILIRKIILFFLTFFCFYTQKREDKNPLFFLYITLIKFTHDYLGAINQKLLQWSFYFKSIIK